MPRAKRVISSSGIYHVLLRGINRQRIFEEENDYLSFLQRLRAILSESDTVILCYCLLSNHVHLLVRTGETRLGDFIRRLTTSYVYHFNKKYERSGHLFEDRFKSEPVEDDAYLITVVDYIHQNPVRAGICEDADSYRWSSLFELGKETSLVDEEELFSLVDEHEVRSPSKQMLLAEPFSSKKRGRKARFTDEEVICFLEKHAGIRTASQFQKCGEADQREMVLKLIDFGVASRQIARVCGVGRGLVLRWSASLSKP